MSNIIKRLNNKDKSIVEHKLRQFCETSDRYLAYSTLMLGEDGSDVEYVSVYDMLDLDNVRDERASNDVHLRYILYPMANFYAEPNVDLGIQVADHLDEYADPDWQDEQHDTGHVQVYYASTDCLVYNTEPCIEILSDASQPPSINVEHVCADSSICFDDLASITAERYNGRKGHVRYAAAYGKYVDGSRVKTRIYVFDRQDVYDLVCYCDGNTGHNDGYFLKPFDHVDIDYTQDDEEITSYARQVIVANGGFPYSNVDLMPVSVALHGDDDILIDLEI